MTEAGAFRFRTDHPDSRDSFNIGVRYEAGIVFHADCIECYQTHGFGFDWHAVAVDGPQARNEAGFICEPCAVRYDENVGELLAYLRFHLPEEGPAGYVQEKIEYGLRWGA